ncbi:MAG: hypothetical protein IJ845_11100 [Bacteroidaceae bacterium]|nr:hypothetical protein [Bacteroidaceae bacterium]
MKTRNLLLALGCAAALTACTTNDEPNVAPAPAKKVVTLNVDVNEPADTRVEYEKNGTTYKFAWSDNDKLRVFYNDGTEKIATFTIDVSSIDGKKADFTSEDFPEDYTGYVTIVYKGRDLIFSDISEDGMENDLWLSGYYGQTTGVAADLANRTLLFAEADVTEAGKLPDVTLNHALSYLLLKKGLQVTQAGLNVGAGDTELLLEVGTSRGISFSSTGCTVFDNHGSIFGDIYVTDGKLDNDCLVPLFVGEGSSTSGYSVSGFFIGSEEYSGVSQPTFTYEPGKIYVVEAGNEKWEPVNVAIPEVIVDLSKLTADYVAQDGDILIGSIPANFKISVAADAVVTLRDAYTTNYAGSESKWAGITCLGDATLVIEGTNHILGSSDERSGIFIPEGYTLTIEGTGKLTAESGHSGAGIGSYYYGGKAGNIIINSGEIVAIGYGGYAGIGGNCGDITINGGTITATGNSGGAGIGSNDGDTCGNITITGGTITATGNGCAAGIGTGASSSSYRSYCGNILITGGSIIAKGSGSIVSGTHFGGSAGIGGSHAYSTCGYITITGSDTHVVATKGGDITIYDIGPGSSTRDYYADKSTCGTVTIGSGVVVKDENGNDAVIYGVS